MSNSLYDFLPTSSGTSSPGGVNNPQQTPYDIWRKYSNGKKEADLLDKGLKSPDYTAVDLDSGTKDLLDKKVSEAQQSNEYFKNKILEGVSPEDSKYKFNGSLSDSMGRTNAQLALGIDPDIQRAINARAQESFSQDLSDIVRGAEIQAPLKKAEAAQGGVQAASQAYNVQHNLAMRKNQAAQDRYFARMAIVAGALGMGGQFVGAYAGRRSDGGSGQQQQQYIGGRDNISTSSNVSQSGGIA